MISFMDSPIKALPLIEIAWLLNLNYVYLRVGATIQACANSKWFGTESYYTQTMLVPDLGKILKLSDIQSDLFKVFESQISMLITYSLAIFIL